MGTTSAEAEMTYDGTQLTWAGLTFKASSGFAFQSSETKVVNHQTASDQCLKDQGPIPSGLYRLSLAVRKNVATVDKSGQMVSQATSGYGIERIPQQFQDSWGANRVGLELIQLHVKCEERRDNFYIHDSHKGFTHGCIETETSFFTELYNYATNQKGRKPTLTLLVKYPSDNASTDGDTYFP